LNTSQNALSQAITRLSSGKRINSAADDAAGLAISNRMQTQINGLNQGVSNANDGVSMIQTASSGLAQITASLQTIRTLAVQASSGSLSSSDQAALQQEVAQQVAEVNRVASQTTYNGKNVLDGSAGNVSFQIGANVGQTISLNLSQGVSAASLGGGVPQAGSTLTSITGVSLSAAGASVATTPAITTVNVLADGNGGFTFTDQNNQALSSTAAQALFGPTAGTTGSATAPTALTLTPLAGGAFSATGVPPASAAVTASIATANALNTPPAVSALDVSTTQGANAAMESIDNALQKVNNIQAPWVRLKTVSPRSRRRSNRNRPTCRAHSRKSRTRTSHRKRLT
jgi:flagellin